MQGSRPPLTESQSRKVHFACLREQFGQRMWKYLPLRLTHENPHMPCGFCFGREEKQLGGSTACGWCAVAWWTDWGKKCPGCLRQVTPIQSSQTSQEQ